MRLGYIIAIVLAAAGGAMFGTIILDFLLYPYCWSNPCPSQMSIVPPQLGQLFAPLAILLFGFSVIAALFGWDPKPHPRK